MGCAETHSMTSGATLLNNFRRRSRETQDFFRIAAAFYMCGSGSVTGFAALSGFLSLQGMDVS